MTISIVVLVFAILAIAFFTKKEEEKKQEKLRQSYDDFINANVIELERWIKERSTKGKEYPYSTTQLGYEQLTNPSKIEDIRNGLIRIFLCAIDEEVTAQYILANFYFKGLRNDPYFKNKEKAIFWASMAIKNGSEDAEHLLLDIQLDHLGPPSM